VNGALLTVAGYVGSAAGQSVFGGARVEVFKSDNDPTGYGEGPVYLGFLTADANGNFSGSLSLGGVGGGDRISGTATDAEDGPLPSTALSWSVVMHHCPQDCHQHPVQEFPATDTAMQRSPAEP